jgi:hypothetical protein
MLLHMVRRRYRSEGGTRGLAYDRPVEDSTPAPPATPRWVVPAALISLSISSVLVAWLVTRGDGDQRFEDHGIAFSYPDGWDLLPPLTPQVPPGFPAPMFVERVGYRDPFDVVFVPAYRVSDLPGGGDVTSRGLDRLLVTFAEAVGGEVEAQLRPIPHASLDAYEARVRAEVAGTPIETRAVFLTDGSTLWAISCQSSAEHRAELERGCDLIVSSFRA